jgi:hypothetical protein
MRRLEYPIAAALYLTLSIWFTWPLAAHPAGTVVDAKPPVLLVDIHLVIWILASVARALVTDPRTIFQANALHPFRDPIARSEHLLGDQPVFAPVYLATGNPVLAYNVVVLGSFVIGALAMHHLVRRWTGRPAAGLVAAVSFAFAAWRVDLGRPHLLQVQYLPLVVLLLDRALATERTRDAILCAVVLTLQCLTSYYVAYASYLVVAAYLGADVVLRGWRRGRAIGIAAIVLLGPLLVLGPVSVPYLRARSGGTLEPGADALGRLPMGTAVRVLGDYVTPGAAALAVLGALVGIRRASPRERVRRIALLACAAAGACLALPGTLGALDPHRWLGLLVPGFASLRVPIRFAAATAFATSALAGMAVARAVARQRSRGAAVAVTGLALLVVTVPVRTHPALAAIVVHTGTDVPAPYRWLARKQGTGALVELPIGGDSPYRESRAALAMYYSTVHWLPLLNGYTGYMPPAYELLERYASALPSPDAIRLLARCADLHWILVHRQQPADRDAFVAAGLRPRKAFRRAPGSRVATEVLYEVPSEVAGPCSTALFRSATHPGDGPARPPPTAELLAPRLPPVVLVGRLLVIELRGANLDAEPWPGPTLDAHARVEIVTRWVPVDAGARVAASAPASQMFAEEVPPSAAFRTFIAVRAPALQARYRLEIGLRRGDADSDAGPRTEVLVEVRAPRSLRRDAAASLVGRIVSTVVSCPAPLCDALGGARARESSLAEGELRG